MDKVKAIILVCLVPMFFTSAMFFDGALTNWCLWQLIVAVSLALVSSLMFCFLLVSD